ncbi:MAG: sporulation protein YqfD [Clostridia bacterium]|nr:sporulation protein YqfD [Clostridia bacterium]
MAVWTVREKLLVEGLMPERALLRLRRAGIDVYNVKKTQKNQILLSVKKKDVEKVFAIYPKVCYNINAYSPYTVRRAGTEGAGKLLRFLKKRGFFVAGALLFCACTLFADSFVFDVEFVGSSVYKREAYAALEEYGIAPFRKYDGSRVDLICSKLLSLDGVEFCSVKKSGAYVRVEMRLDNTPTRTFVKGDMVAAHTGEIVAITTLRGTPLKRKGEKVQAGEMLVGGWFTPAEGGQVRVEPIARASIACVYEAEIAAEDEESAFAAAYLALGLSESDTLTKREVVKKDESYAVRIEYTAIERMNL